MKYCTFLACVAMVCATVVFVSTRVPAGAAAVSVNINGATFTDLPLVQSHSAALRINTPTVPGTFNGGSVRALESQMPVDAGLVLTHVSSQSSSGDSEYWIYVDGELLFAGGLSYSTVTLMMQPMAPILIRPGRLLRIEFRTTGGSPPLVNLQGYAVSNAALYP